MTNGSLSKTSSSSSLTPAPEETFPVKLYQMLLDVEKAGETNIICWSNDGKYFSILEPKMFAKTWMTRTFNQSKYKSFQRQLNLYNFVREQRGKIKGVYSHPLFLRGKPELVKQIRRTRATPSSSSSSSASSSAHNSPSTRPVVVTTRAPAAYSQELSYLALDGLDDLEPNNVFTNRSSNNSNTITTATTSANQLVPPLLLHRTGSTTNDSLVDEALSLFVNNNDNDNDNSCKDGIGFIPSFPKIKTFGDALDSNTMDANAKDPPSKKMVVFRGSQQHSALQECSHEPLLHYPNFRLEGLPPPSTTLVAAKATSFLLHSAVATMSETTSTTGSSSTSAPFANDDDDSESIGTIDENDSKGDASDFFLHQDEYSSSSLEPLPIHSSMELYHEKLYSIF